MTFLLLALCGLVLYCTGHWRGVEKARNDMLRSIIPFGNNLCAVPITKADHEIIRQMMHSEPCPHCAELAGTFEVPIEDDVHTVCKACLRAIETV